MRFNELNLNKLVPANINDSPNVISRGSINEFFLRGFELYYNAIQNQALAPAAPFSLEALACCNDEELNRLLDEAGVEDYADLEKETKEKFIYALATTKLGTEQVLDAIIKFAFDSQSVSGASRVVAPHEFDIDAEGDLVRSDVTTAAIHRITNNLNKFNLVTERLHGLSFTQCDSVTGFVGGVSHASGWVRETVSTTYTVWLAVVPTSNISVVKVIKDNFGYNLADAKAINDGVRDTGIPAALGEFSTSSEAESKAALFDETNAAVLVNTGDQPVAGAVWSKSGSYQTYNTSLGAGSSALVYAKGASVTESGSTTGEYTILGLYTNADTKIINPSVTLSTRASDGKLIITNTGSSAVSWCYVEYQIL